MKVSRLGVAILFGFVILFLHSHELAALSTDDVKQIEKATTAVRSLAKAMKALEFIKWISSVGSVLGPAMMAVSFILNIVFSFLGLESPEMKFMKAEFKALNNRLDHFSEEFQQVKKKIDWSSVQLSYGKVEANIRSLAVYRRKITDAQTQAAKDDAASNFKRKYETNYASDSEILYNAMVSGSSLSDNIFEASATYTDQNPELSGKFMQGAMQLLMESFQIQGTYIYLKFNNSIANEYHANSSTKKMNQVMAKSKEIYIKMQNNFKQQSLVDLKRMALANLNLNHDQFADLFYKFISSKYVNRLWFVAIYNPVKTYEEHYIANNGGVTAHLFAGRNMFLTSISTQPRKSWTIPNVQFVLNFGEFNRYHNGAEAVWGQISWRNKQRGYPVQDCAIVKHPESLKYRCSKSHCSATQKSVYWCNDPACWGWGRRYYDVVVFG